jgi:predicted GTPase
MLVNHLCLMQSLENHHAIVDDAAGTTRDPSDELIAFFWWMQHGDLSTPRG